MFLTKETLLNTTCEYVNEICMLLLQKILNKTIGNNKEERKFGKVILIITNIQINIVFFRKTNNTLKVISNTEVFFLTNLTWESSHDWASSELKLTQKVYLLRSLLGFWIINNTFIEFFR